MNKDIIKLLELIEAQRLSIDLLTKRLDVVSERLDIANDRVSNLYDHVIKRTL